MDETAGMRIFQVVGYKNAGKTTVTEALIAYLTRRGYQVATLKHHGHGGNPDSLTQTDSERHHQAGAVISGVQGDNELQLTLNMTPGALPETIQGLYEKVPHDILLLEGYKSLAYPKIALLRDEDDVKLLDQVDNIVAVGCHDQTLTFESDAITFDLDNLESAIPKLAAHILVKVKK